MTIIYKIVITSLHDSLLPRMPDLGNEKFQQEDHGAIVLYLKITSQICSQIESHILQNGEIHLLRTIENYNNLIQTILSSII